MRTKRGNEDKRRSLPCNSAFSCSEESNECNIIYKIYINYFNKNVSHCGAILGPSFFYKRDVTNLLSKQFQGSIYKKYVKISNV
jgi:hypothetical protein